ncbi:24-dehydrocholesterol reductase [Diaporthe sp. PMI_573]|nr:24-dehydrocholesterol reductase [Diaporthaceae sp. PMI_573]
MDRHYAAVKEIAASVREFYDRKEPYRISHGNTNSTRPKGNMRTVDISALGHVLAVDKAKRIVLVEPNVAMDSLVEATLPHGLVPPIVMEFPGITAGGGFAGTGGESSSFRHGFFDETVERIEMVLANGEIVTASRNERSDLFRAAPGAVGTLGIVTLLEINLMPAKKYVHTRYYRTNSTADAVKLVREETINPENDYVDGILYSKDYGVIITGTLTDEKPDNVKPQTFSGAWDPWFYLHVEEQTSKPRQDDSSKPEQDYIPLAEYLFRYDRGAFWVGRFTCMYWLLPFNRLSRWVLDDLLHTRMMYRGLDTGLHNTFTIQDIAMPFETAETFVNYLDENHPIWPLWLCPMKRRPPPTFHPFTTRPGKDGEDDMMLNVGVWGHEGTFDPPAFIAKNSAIEDKVRSLGGTKWLYAHVYQSEADFWAVYGGRGWYDKLRAKYHASALPSVYDKVHVRWDDVQAAIAARQWTRDRFAWLKVYWPIGGIWSAAVSYASGDQALHRNATWKWKGEK